SPWPHSAQWPLCWRWDCSSPDRAVPNWSVVLWTGRVSSRPGPSAAVTVAWSWASPVVSACVTASTSPDAWSTGAVPMGTVEHLAVVGRGSRPRLVLDRFFDLGRGESCPAREGVGAVDAPEPPRPVPSTAKGGGFGQDRFQAPPREGWGGTHPLFYRALHPRAGKSTNTGT